MGIEADKKIEWLLTADRFFANGDFKAMRACAREILSHDLDDFDGLALLAQASLYLGETGSVDSIVHRVAAAAPQHWRILLVAAEQAVQSFELRQAIPVLRRLWRLGETRTGEIPSYDRTILERAGRMLADAYYLLGRAREASDMCFALSAFVESTEMKAELYGKALFLMNYLPVDAHTVARREGYNAFFGAKVTMPHTRPDSVPKRKLRIGYISPDFREHAVAHFLTPFLRDYSKLDFNVYCYHRGHSDAVTRRFKRFAVNWRDISEVSPPEAAKAIYSDRIDILVDFSGHSQGSCLPILSYKPAPIQMTAIGDINTTGLRENDYFLSDMTCLPSNRPIRGFTEKVALLPYCHLCYAPDIVKSLPQPAKEPAAKRNGYVTFGSFNNFAKASRETLVLWRGALEATPGSRLLIKGKIGSIPDGKAEVMERLGAIGIDTERVDIRPYSPDYLEQYADVDIALDTTPYNGGLTTCEALSMGVPVVSLRGATHGSSYGATILENAGLPELIAANEIESVRKVARIASSLPILEKFHSGLRSVVEHSRLMDGPAYMKDMETLYRRLWADYCGGGR
ncbi:MAG: hypothetical protein IJS96_03210 [Schwartzia sp.]|nr:hypothetical protein [Schwartzia sp. (in: firmicutes)]